MSSPTASGSRLQRVAVAGPAGREGDRDDVVLHVRPGRPALELVAPLAADAARAEHLGDVEVDGVPGLQSWHQVRAGHADARNGARGVAAEQALRCLDLRVVRDAHLGVPALLLGGAKSPEHLHVRLDALARVLPRLESVVILKGQGHIANARAPAKVARIIETFADTVMP